MTELSEPLRTVVPSATRLMHMGHNGTASKGSTQANYAALTEAHRADVVSGMRKAFEEMSGRRLTLRLANSELVPEVFHHQGVRALLCLAICRYDTPEGVVTTPAGADALYLIEAREGLNYDGWILTRVM